LIDDIQEPEKETTDTTKDNQPWEIQATLEASETS